MTLSTSSHNFLPEIDVLDRALGSANGIRVRCASRNDAINYRHRLHQARRIDRLESTKIYSEGEPLWNKSQYDPLIVRMKELPDGIFLYIQIGVFPKDIEEIPSETVAQLSLD